MAGLEPTVPWSQATWGAAPLHPASQSERLDLNQRSPGPQPGAMPDFATLCCHQMTRVGFEPNLASLKGWQPHQKSNGPCLCTHNLRGPEPAGTIVDVGWKALESFSPGLQPGAKPSQLPAHQVFAFPPGAENEKARCPLRDTGRFESLRMAVRPMSRAQGIRGFSATQTCTPGIPDYLEPDLGMHGLRCEKVRLFGKPPRTALIAIEHLP